MTTRTLTLLDLERSKPVAKGGTYMAFVQVLRSAKLAPLELETHPF